MKKIALISTTFLLMFIIISFTSFTPDNKSLIKKNLAFAEEQESLMLVRIGSSRFNPRGLNEDGTLKLVKSKDWTSGFFPGCLWYIYEYTKDDKWKKSAEFFTNNVEQEQFNGTTHDMGFKMFCSYGNGYRLTGNEKYKKILIQSAKTLSTRFNPVVGCIRSWDHNSEKWEYPVIIDNMMNLELLFWASSATGDSAYYKIAVTHANTTMKNHFRSNYSTWHVVNYDTVTGDVISKETHQGYSNESCWSRGEAWALYGYTMCYRETKDPRYLTQAKNIADYILKNKNLPEDMIPYWDYNAPNIPDEQRDASAASIMCSAFYELSSYAGEEKVKYMEAANNILSSLSSKNYLAVSGNNENFILMHSVGSKPAGSEVDEPLIYADYYFIEANLRGLKYYGKP